MGVREQADLRSCRLHSQSGADPKEGAALRWADPAPLSLMFEPGVFTDVYLNIYYVRGGP